MHIEHINISAPPSVIEAEKEFFCYIFDLRVGFRPNFSRLGYWLYSDDQALIHLTVSEQHSESNTQHYLDHIAFQMEGVDALITKLRDLNVEFKTDSLKEIGMAQIFFNSPAGIGLEANFLNETLPN